MENTRCYPAIHHVKDHDPALAHVMLLQSHDAHELHQVPGGSRFHVKARAGTGVEARIG